MIGIPKPPKRRKRLLRNPIPTADDHCEDCGSPYAQTHEVYGGAGRRQVSMKYGMQRRLCDRCHRYLTTARGHDRDMELKKMYQERFEKNHSREEFIRLFGRNYLE